MEPVLNPGDITKSPNDRTLVTVKSQVYSEHAVRGVLQPSDLLLKESDITFRVAIVTITDGIVIF